MHPPTWVFEIVMGSWFTYGEKLYKGLPFSFTEAERSSRLRALSMWRSAERLFHSSRVGSLSWTIRAFPEYEQIVTKGADEVDGYTGV